MADTAPTVEQLQRELQELQRELQELREKLRATEAKLEAERLARHNVEAVATAAVKRLLKIRQAIWADEHAHSRLHLSCATQHLLLQR